MTILLGARLGLSFVVLITVFRFGTTTRILQQLDHNELERNVTLFEIDILSSLNISEEMRGVSVLKGTASQHPAWRFHPPFDHVQLPHDVVTSFLSHLRCSISLFFSFRQHRKSIATLVSINSPGKMSPWFRVTSNLKHGGLSVFYHIKEDTHLHLQEFDLQHLNNWTRLALTITGQQASLYINCNAPQTAKLAGQLYLSLPHDALVYFRQEPGYRKKFIGSVQIARLSTGGLEFRPWHCPSEGNVTSVPDSSYTYTVQGLV